MKSFCSIESHSCYSTLDGFPAPSRYFERAKEVGIDGVAISDHVSLAGAVDVQKASEKYGIKGITGIELNIARPDVNGEKQRNYAHLLVYAKNEVGWKNLLYLNYLSTTPEKFYYKPRIYKEDLFAHSEGLIVSSNCIGSIVPREIFTEVNLAARSSSKQEASQYIDTDWENKTKKLIEEYKSIFKDDFYIGASIHNLAAQQLQLDIVRELCKKFDIKLMPDCDSHYSHPEDAYWQECLICISTGKTVHQREKLRQEGTDLLFGDNSLYYLYKPEEMRQYFSQPELNNTYELFDKCNFKLSRQSPKIPEIYENPNYILKSLCNSRLKELNLDYLDQYKKQLEEEIELYVEFNLAGYMLLVKDIFEEAKKLNILCSARGSVGGSLVAYLLGIVPLDPIKYDLLFVRFLNRGRMSKNKISLPDVDIDSDSEKRDILINRIKDKYGHNNTAQMSTNSILGPKGAIKDAFRITARYEEREKFKSIAESISKHIPNKMQGAPDVTLESVVEHSEVVRDFKKQYPEQFEMAEHLCGVVRANSVHAAGLIIGTQPLVEIAPIHYSKNMGGLVTNCDMNSAEFFGLVKMDILGLRNLSIHDHANKLYQQLYNEKESNYFSIETLPLEGKLAEKTWELAGTGHTLSTFQLDSYLGRKYSKAIKPKSIAEVAQISSIVRPGVLDCLSGDTSIITGSYCWETGYKVFIYKNIKTLYKNFENNKNGKNKKYNNSIVSLNTDTNTFFLNKVKNIWKTGTKKLFNIKLMTVIDRPDKEIAQHYRIKASAGHQFLTIDGWKKLENLQYGDYICVHRKRFQKTNKSPTKNGVNNVNNFRNIAFYSYLYKCILCDWVHGAGSLDTHHIEDNRYINNNVNNLCFLCPNHHRMVSMGLITKEELLTARKNFELPTSKDILFCRVLGTEEISEEETYDIEVEGPFHNYIANGFIVHNSKTESGISLSDSFIKRKNGEEEIIPIHEKLKECLKHTYGYWIFQEDLTKAVSILTGWNLQEADLLRIATAKKLPAEMAILKPKFIKDCLKENISEIDSNRIFDIIEKSQRYLFGKNHAMLYSATSYVDLFMKANYPLIFYCSNLVLAHEGAEKWDTTRDLITDARKFGIEFLPPSLNNTNETFSIIDNKIRVGFSNLKGLGKAHQKVVKKIKNIKTWNEFLIRSLRAKEDGEDNINKTVVETLIKSGCLDFMKLSRDHMLFEYGFLREFTSREFRFIEKIIKNNENFDLKDITNKLIESDVPNKSRAARIKELLNNTNLELYKMLPTERAAFWEKECIGTAITCKYTDNYDTEDCTHDCSSFYTSDDIYDLKVAGMIESLNIIMDRKSNQMARFIISDGYNNIPCLIFSSQFKELSHNGLLKDGEMVKVIGNRSKNDESSMVVNKIEILN